MVHCVETQKCSNCTTLDLFGIHQQMLTDGTCGHSTSFTEMFLFALPVFEIESVLLRQLMMLFYVFLILMPWRAYVFHISSLWKFVADIALWDMLLPVKHCVLRNLPAKKKKCHQLSVTFFSIDRTSYAFHAAVLISRMFVTEYLKRLGFTCGSQHVVNIPCTMEKKQRFPGWVWVKHVMRRDPASWTAFNSTVQNNKCWVKGHWFSSGLYISKSS